MSLAEAPGDDAPEVEPLDGSDVQAVLTVAAGVRSGARWVLALVTGMRQGEILGLQWEDISWDTGEIVYFVAGDPLSAASSISLTAVSRPRFRFNACR